MFAQLNITNLQNFDSLQIVKNNSKFLEISTTLLNNLFEKIIINDKDEVELFLRLNNKFFNGLKAKKHDNYRLFIENASASFWIELDKKR